jgi:hypothetical protein
MDDIKPFSLVKPSINTPFHIDFSWWKAHDNNWHVYLQGYLCPDHQLKYSQITSDSMVDWVDPITAEVTQVDGLQQVLMLHCAKQPGFLEGNTMVDSIFRIFLSNGNLPLAPSNLESMVGQSATKILLTIGGGQVYKGLRPFLAKTNQPL